MSIIILDKERKYKTMPTDKTKLIENIEVAVDELLTEHILFYMSEYREVADYYFIADVFKHKCSALALRIANEMYREDEEDEE
jgi:hypothetical protein